MSHTPKSSRNLLTVKSQVGHTVPKRKRNTRKGMPKRSDIEVWPQRTAFRKRLKEYGKAQSLTQAEVATQLGLTLSTLRMYLYDTTRRPTQRTLEKASQLFGCSVTEWIDDPGAERPGGVDLSNESPIDRYRFDQMLIAMSDKSLSDVDRQILFEDFMNSVQRLTIIKGKVGKK